jgi:peptidyl-prolyl cis-trans isomerase SurA
MDLKRQYNYKLDSAGILKLTDQLIDEEEKLYLNRIIPFLTDDTYLFEFDGNVYQIKDFARYLQNLPKELTSSFKDKYLFDEAFKRFSNNEVIKHEKNQLKEKYPEYKYVVKEYHDGILLFEIMDRKIWSKASEDSAGLKKYYERNKENYKWGERYRGKIYICESEEILKEVKKLKKGGLFRKSYSDKEVLDELNTDEKKRVKIIEDLFHKGDHPIIDNEVWNIGNQKSIENKHYIVKGEIVPPSVKSLEEARGSVIADYQNYLEEQWIKELRDQYSIEINEKVLEQLKEKSEK